MEWKILYKYKGTSISLSNQQSKEIVHFLNVTKIRSDLFDKIYERPLKIRLRKAPFHIRSRNCYSHLPTFGQLWFSIKKMIYLFVDAVLTCLYLLSIPHYNGSLKSKIEKLCFKTQLL